MNRAYLSLGSNVDKEANLPRAIVLLAAAGRLAACSPAYATAPVGTTNQPTFLNAAVLLLTERPAEAIKREVIADIETGLGRVRDPADRNAPRTIDIDISLWNDEVLLVDGRPVPDPDILIHAHVAAPLARIAPDLRHPLTGRSLASIAAWLQARGVLVTPRPEIDLSLGGP